jgi:hypothetical protein
MQILAKKTMNLNLKIRCQVKMFRLPLPLSMHQLENTLFQSPLCIAPYQKDKTSQHFEGLTASFFMIKVK